MSCYQLIKTMTKFEKRTNHRLIAEGLNVVMNGEKHSSLLNKVHRNSARKMTRTVQLQAWRVHCPINSRTWLAISSPIWALIGQCTRHACNWTVRVILRALLRCTFLSKLLCFSPFITTFNRSALNRWFVRFSNFVIVLINWYQDIVSSKSVCNHIRD